MSSQSFLPTPGASPAKTRRPRQTALGTCRGARGSTRRLPAPSGAPSRRSARPAYGRSPPEGPLRSRRRPNSWLSLLLLAKFFLEGCDQPRQQVDIVVGQVGSFVLGKEGSGPQHHHGLATHRVLLRPQTILPAPVGPDVKDHHQRLKIGQAVCRGQHVVAVGLAGAGGVEGAHAVG